ncbi:MAG: GTP-binding protein HSR1 [Planctomycetes bacterium HGW-Planctomycetes-1]|nr:MAG: GTP-binding protein HSR1 [Planctomycetes bacterium HGW-Planctomycetes-1]
MPANLTPDYLKADKWFKEAATDEERILALEEMMRVIPKHKGTDHMRAELRRKYSALKESAEKKKKVSHGPDPFHIPKSGAGQVVLLGLPNNGKSSIVAATTHAKAQVADFPFATSIPLPGMAQFEDIKIEIVDMPPITTEYAPAGIVNTLRNCDLIGVVIDLSSDIAQQIKICFDFLGEKRLLLDKDNTLGKKCFVIAAKADISSSEKIDELKKLLPKPYEITAVSVNDKASLDKMLADIFRLLDIVRIYAKKPGQRPDMTEPFILPRGSNVIDLAQSIHRELAEKLRTARCWGSGVHDGQNVHKTHILNDKDIIELHFA